VPLPDALGGETTIELPPKILAASRDLVEELSLAALIGGNLFGRLGMGPALRSIADKAERGKVLNRAWRSYGMINSLALVTLVSTWIASRRVALTGLRVSRRQRTAVLVKDVTVGAVVVTGLASAAGGVGFARSAPGGAVPVDSGHAPAPETPGRAARLKRLLNVLGGLNLLFEIALVAVNVLLLRPRRR
jgi:hypothetical protein